MKVAELRQLDRAALTQLQNENLEKLRELRFKTGQGELKNVRELRSVKKLIAQIKTVMNMK